MSRNVTDEELQEPLPDFDETSAPLLLNAIEIWDSQTFAEIHGVA